MYDYYINDYYITTEKTGKTSSWAKADAKEAAKNKSKDTPTPNKPEVNQTKTEVNQTTIQEEKSPEEIKAEREAKKMAKAAAKSAAKNKNKTVNDGDAKPKEIESSKDMPGR